MKFLKVMLFVAASVIMGLVLIFLPEESGVVSVTYISAVGLYLGVDMAGMIAKTVSLPKGEFKSLNVHKYVVASVCLFILTVISLVMKEKADISTAVTSFIASVMIIISILLGGLEGNNIATDKGTECSES